MSYKNIRELFRKIAFKEWVIKWRYEITIALAVVVIAFTIPIRGEFKYKYQRGGRWQYETLEASVDFPILKNSLELKEERDNMRAATPPIYNQRGYGIALYKLQKRLSEAIVQGQGDKEMELHRLYNFIEELYKKGVVDLPPSGDFSGNYITILSSLEEVTHLPLASIVTPEEGYRKIYHLVEESRLSLSLLGELFPSAIVTPNLIYNSEATTNAIKRRLDEISPSKGVLYAGQPIVINDELITAQTEQILDSYRTEWEHSVGFSGNRYLLKVGHLFFIISITLLILFTLSYMPKELHPDRRGVLFILFILAVVVLIISNRIEMGDNYLFAIPFSVIVLFLYSFFFDALVLPIYMILLTPLLIIASRGVEIYLINMFAGGAAFYTFRIWNRGWLQFLNTIVIFVVLSLGYSSLRLIEGGALSSIDTALFIYFGWNAILVIAAYPLLFLFEKLFGLLSYSRLRDLSDPTTKLLSRLAKEAPGTFHHSLQVANLAESAAAEIGANPILARVGALYHDIGKLSNPLYFVENMRLGEGREDPHASLSYQKSAAIILSHIPDGIRLAEKRRVPRLVQGFILSHHGTTQSRYFYNLYLNEGGDPSAVESFSYKGRVPYSKEEAIVMIADTVEAASRTLKDFLPETIERFVNEMVEQKINEGQFIKSSITLSELEIVKGVMKEKLAQYHHNRIEYPSITEELES